MSRKHPIKWFFRIDVEKVAKVFMRTFEKLTEKLSKLAGSSQALEHNVISALEDSRARYKDLVDISSDFAWEIGKDHEFIFVSTSGALDYPPEEIIDRSPEEFGLVPINVNVASPFFSKERAVDVTVQMIKHNGELAQLKVSSLPLFDASGEWCGNRGICRDVTEDSRRRMALSEARIREKLLKHLIGIIRDEVEPLKSLTESLKYIVGASSFAGGKIFMFDEYNTKGERFTLMEKYGDENNMPSDALIKPAIRARKETRTVAGEDGGGLLATTGYRHNVNGAICVWRHDGSSDWTEDETELIDTISDQLGIAIERVMHHERVVRLSRTDELTGLLNRRAFLEEELPRRMERLQHSGGTAALLFVDLDNFKMVNDIHGHHQGDEVLMLLARFLQKYSRPGDAVARFGGDEFAIWLDGMDGLIAKKRAEVMIEDSAQFKKYSGDDEHPLGLSIGVSMYDSASSEELDDLIKRADEAMYKVKRDGKGGYAFDEASQL